MSFWFYPVWLHSWWCSWPRIFGLSHLYQYTFTEKLSLLCYSPNIIFVHRAPKSFYSTALLQLTSLHKVFSIGKCGTFPLPTFGTPALYSKQAQKGNPFFNPLLSAQTQPTQVFQKEVTCCITRTYLCPKLAVHWLAQVNFPQQEQHPWKNVPQPVPLKIPAALHLPLSSQLLF